MLWPVQQRGLEFIVGEHLVPQTTDRALHRSLGRLVVLAGCVGDGLEAFVEHVASVDELPVALSQPPECLVDPDAPSHKQGGGPEVTQRSRKSRAHGGNKRLIEELLVDPETVKRFQYTVLQILPKTATVDEIVAVETLYKNKLLSKAFGLNAN